MVVGVVGKSCSGKDETVKFLVNEGFYEINGDKLGHEALKQKVDELVSSFGSTILKDGEVDRKILGPIVFSDPEKLKILNSCRLLKMLYIACRMAYHLAFIPLYGSLTGI